MSRKILFSFILTSLFIQPAWSGDLQTYLDRLIANEVKKECQSCEVDVFIHNEAIVEDIAQPDQVIADRWRGQTNLILKMGQESRLLTVTIRWHDLVGVAKKNIKQGQILQKKDIAMVRKDVTFLQTAYANQLEDVVGLSVRRVFKRGQVIDESYLKKPLSIKYGQPVKVLLDEGSLQLVMPGLARGAGAIGDRVPVYLASTKKKVSAIVIDKNTVRIQ